MESEVREQEIFSKLIKEIRTSRNLSQRELAQFFSPRVSPQAIGQWERGEAFPGRKHWQTLAKLAGMDAGQFYEYVGVGSPSSSSLLEDIIHKIRSLTFDQQLEVVSEVTSDFKQESSQGILNKQHLALLKKGVQVWNRWRQKNPDILPQLSGLDLCTENCSDLKGYNLDGADLTNIEGRYVSLKGASLVQANLEKANFKEVTLDYANLREAKLEGSKLEDVGLRYVDLTGANLSKASIKFADFQKAILDEANFSQAYIFDAKFRQASLKKANLKEVTLRSSDLTEVNLNEAKLVNATVSDCIIYGLSAWGTETDGAFFEKLYVSPDGRSGLPVSDLILAPTLYLHRHNPRKTLALTQSFLTEKKALELVDILVDRYGECSHTEGFRIFINVEDSTIKKISGQYMIIKRKNSLTVERLPNFRDIQAVLEGKNESKFILRLVDNLLESDVKEEDIENLNYLVQWEKSIQEPRFKTIMSLLEQILTNNNNTELKDENYVVERRDEEIILLTNSSHQIELMRARLKDGQWSIVNCSLSQKAVDHFQKLSAEVKGVD
jgi:uncharacterized protein YjbI with pentapeptide repeats/DNA-binding XRE family transcriptional regulator